MTSNPVPTRRAVDRLGSRVQTGAQEILWRMLQIDDGELDQEMMREFPAARLRLAEELGRAQEYDAELLAEGFKTDAQIKKLQEWKAALASRRAALHQHIADAVRASPGVPFKPPFGEPVRLQKNGGIQPLKVSLDLGRPKSVDKILPHDTKVPERFQKQVSFVVLDTDAVRVALAAGEKLPWATLEERGVHLKGFALKEPKEKDLEAAP